MSEKYGELYETSNMITVEWKIKNFLCITDNSGELFSPTFQLSEAQLFIQIYPNGKTSVNTGWISLYLWISSQTVHSIKFNIAIKQADGSFFKCQHGSIFQSQEELFFKRKATGWSEFVERSQLSSIENVLDSQGTLTICCEARTVNDSVKEVETQTSNNNKDTSIETLLLNFEQLYVSGCQSDVIITVKGEKFSAHKSILSARSSVFQSMFEHDMKEKDTGVVNIIDCDPKSFGSFLLFLYNGKLDIVSSINALDLYVIVDKYNTQDLKKACCECLTQTLSQDSICDVLRLAALHQEYELLQTAKDYFIKNATEILKTAKWQTFLAENHIVANELFIKFAEKLTNIL